MIIVREFCMICKEVNNWRCVKCTVAAHTKCSPWKEHVLTLEGGKQAVCWRHTSNWLLQNENDAVTNDVKRCLTSCKNSSCQIRTPQDD
jgi:hypothetical protein